jgi:hypothetical protein
LDIIGGLGIGCDFSRGYIQSIPFIILDIFGMFKLLFYIILCI